MKTTGVLGLIVLLLLSCLSRVVLACPPPECPDCYVWDSEGEQCIFAYKYWTANGQISGTITVNDTWLCMTTGHNAYMVYDYDYWYSYYPSFYYGYQSDSLTYEWTKTAGTNPQTGEWTTGTKMSYVGWQAPPCAGTVNIKVTINDKPDPLPNCDRGSRNDLSRDFEDTADVYLPTGCEYAGSHDSSVHWTHNYDFYATCDGWGHFYSHRATYDLDFKYSNCKWVCEISNVQAKTEVEVWHPNRPGYVCITEASDVPCGPNDQEALLAKSDLNDPDLTDDIGAPLTKYWIHQAICVHELQHESDWKAYYGAALAEAITFAEANAIQTIYCDPPEYGWTKTCQHTCDHWRSAIEALFQGAWDEAHDDMDEPTTPVREDEVRALQAENVIEQPVSDALPGDCTL
jgi:hypothetical protein